MKLYKYYRPVDYAFANFEKEVLCFNAVSNFSDQMEGAYKMISNVELEGETEVDKMINRAYHALAREMSTVYTDAIRFQYRILSMTDRMDYRYMWNAYAQNGEGFCLEYECADVGQVADGSGFIRYLNQKMADGVFEDAKSTEEDLHKQIWNILFSKILLTDDGKVREEKYEKEHEIRFVRCVRQEEIEEVSIEEYMRNHLCKEPDKNDTYFAEFFSRKHFKSPNLHFEKVTPVKVFVGDKMSEENRERIERKAVELGIEVQKVQAEELKD